MSTRQTSFDMYLNVRETGILSSMRLKVYEIICRHDYSKQTGVLGLTAMELRYYAETVFHYKNSEHLPKRLSELERYGVIKVVDTRICRRTGSKAIAWAITGNMPLEEMTAAPSSRKEKAKEAALSKLRIVYEQTDERETSILANIHKVANAIKEI